MHFCPWRGIVAPVALLALGGYCLITQTGWIPGGRGAPGMTIHGIEAIVMGMMFITLGIGLHLQFALTGFQALLKPAYYGSFVAYIIWTVLVCTLLLLINMRIFA